MKIIKRIISLLILLSMLVTSCPAMIGEAKAATAKKEKTINILFIGNSKTYFNNMPAILNNMLYKSGKTANYKVLVKGSASLNFHYHYIKEHPEQLKELFKNEKIDYLILNEQTDVQLAPYGTVYDSKLDPDPEKNYPNKRVYGNLSVDALRVVKKLRSYDMITKTGTKIILNATWNYSDLENIEMTNSYFEMTKEAIVEAGYKKCTIAFSGNAVKSVSEEMDRIGGTLTKQELFVDEKHPTQLGSYIEAMALYKAMFGKNMIADYAGSVSSEKMKESRSRYVVFENYIYRKLPYSNEKDFLKRAFNETKLRKIQDYQQIIKFLNNCPEDYLEYE